MGFLTGPLTMSVGPLLGLHGVGWIDMCLGGCVRKEARGSGMQTFTEFVRASVPVDGGVHESQYPRGIDVESSGYNIRTYYPVYTTLQ